MRLVKSPAKRVILVVGFTDIYTAADAVPHFMRCGPIAIEGLDRAIIRGLQARGLKKDEIALLPAGDAWVVLEFGADTQDDAVRSGASRRGVFFVGRGRAERVGDARRRSRAAGQGVVDSRDRRVGGGVVGRCRARPDPVVGWEDAAVDPLRLGDYLRAFQALVDRYGYETSLYGHFGDGCVHARITFDLRSAEGVATWRKFLREAAELVVEFGGSLSGEHGDGQAKAEFLPIMYGPELMQAMEQFKAIWDPANRLNPGKVVHAYRVDENLRMGPAYKPGDAANEADLREPGRRRLSARDRTMHRHGQMPLARRRHDVPELSRDARRELLDARPRASVLGNAARRRDRRRLAKPRSEGGARYVPRVQGLQIRLPDAYGHGVVQGGISFALLRDESPAASGAVHGADRRMGAVGGALSASDEFHDVGTGFGCQLGKWVAGVAQARELPKFATHTYRQIARRSPQTALDARSLAT